MFKHDDHIPSIVETIIDDNMLERKELYRQALKTVEFIVENKRFTHSVHKLSKEDAADILRHLLAKINSDVI
jgi:hypothetical protein